MTTTPQPETVGGEVLKSFLPAFLGAQSGAGIDGEYLWPINPQALGLLYRSSAEHSRSIHIKAESAFGGGISGPGSSVLEGLCETGSAELFVSLDLDIGTYGNGFLQIIRAGTGENGRIVALRRLPAITMSRVSAKHTRGAGFLQRIWLPNGGSEKIHFSEDEIIQLRAPCPFGRAYSLPSWIGAEGMLELAQSAIRYNSAFFNNNAIPEFWVHFQGVTPSDKQKNAIKEFFANDYKGVDNAHRTLVTHGPEEATVTFKQLTADVKDADFLKLMDAARDRLPVAHGVPPRMLGIMVAGSLGAGSEITGQLFIFEHLTLKPKRRQMLDQLRPLLKKIGLRPGKEGEKLENDQILFESIDLTPPTDISETLPALVEAEIVSTDEARELLSWLNSDASTSPAKREKSASRDGESLAVLAQLLGAI